MFEILLTVLFGVFQCWLLWKVLKFIIGAKILKAVIVFVFKLVCYALILPLLLKAVKWLFILTVLAVLIIGCLILFAVTVIKGRR